LSLLTILFPSECYCLHRYLNSPHEELLNAAIEQQKITEQRLRRVVAEDGGAAASCSAGAADRRAGQILMHLQGGKGVWLFATNNYQFLATTSFLLGNNLNTALNFITSFHISAIPMQIRHCVPQSLPMS
jgi:hypothetical protein